MQRITLPALAAALVQLLIAASADAADLKLFGGGHFQGSGQPLVEAFSRKAGIIASYTPGNTGGPALKRRLDAGEMMDVIVMNRDDMDHQVEAGLIRRDTVVDFARDGMGVDVHLDRVPLREPDLDVRLHAKELATVFDLATWRQSS